MKSLDGRQSTRRKTKLPTAKTRPPSQGKTVDRLSESDVEVSLDGESTEPLGCTVVGVGASAGGLEALGKLFAAMPLRSGLACVVVQHLSPDYKSFMVELLSKRTAIPVLRAEHGMEVEPDRIYLIPPGKHLKIAKRRLQLVSVDNDHRLHLPIDVFFRSLAEDQGAKAVGIVLSGTGSDGTMGIRAIKDVGGLVLVQSETSAQFDGMPRSAIATGLADLILPPEEMPRKLLQYLRHPFVARAEAATERLGDDPSLQQVFAILRERCGVDFSGYKRATIDRRIERRMSINQIQHLVDYCRHLEASPREATMLFHELLICVTRFFRDGAAWEYLGRNILPELTKRASKDRTLRLWVPACSTGEEAYSLAMLLAEAPAPEGTAWDIKIFATDIAREALETASQGVYPESVVADLPPALLAKYFVKRPDGYQVATSLRKMVVFARHDLLKDPPFTRLDLVSCRNVLIYFQQPVQRRVLDMFHFALKPDSFMLLGPSEALGELSGLFRTVSVRHKVYQCRSSLRRPRWEGSHTPVRRPSGTSEMVPAVRPVSGQGQLLESIHRKLIAEHVPPCLVVDEANEVLHLLGPVGQYLEPAPGAFGRDLFRLLPAGLSAAVAGALKKASRAKGEFIYDNVRCQIGGATRYLRLRVSPVEVPGTSSLPLRLLFIEEKTPPKAGKGQSEDFDAARSDRDHIKDLEQELADTRESLQATIEELESSNEELQTANEEMLAANEELQSTNEELQSVNEELHTVNTENQNRIEELTDLTNDINNLLASSHVGTMLVDNSMRIRRASSALFVITALTEEDIGAPIETAARLLRFPDLAKHASEVLEKRIHEEWQLDQPDGRTLLLRLAPYLTETGEVRGLVVTVIDITRRRQAERSLSESESRTRGIIDAFPANIAVVDLEGTIRCVNHAWEDFARTNGGDPARLGLGANYFAACPSTITDDDGLTRKIVAGLRAVLEGRSPQFVADYPCDAPGKKRWFRLHAMRIAGQTSGIVISHHDLTDLISTCRGVAPAESLEPSQRVLP
ncbi:MAG: PAS domain-containing protein [Verrucomicrobiales bacterium]|nr:PAS domain-containing protein [Verrucomicrobiales bacterium]